MSAALALVLAGGLAGCGGSEVQVTAPPMSPEERAACTDLVDALPDTLAGELRRPVDPPDAPGAAWGDPALVLTCGVARPSSWRPDAPCTEMGGVGWFVPEEELGDPRVALTATATTHTPYVSLIVPAAYRTKGVDAALSELADPLVSHLTAGDPCV